MRFVYRQEFATEPIASALRRRGWQTIASHEPEEAMMRGDADIALAPPLQYAAVLGVIDYALVPKVAITTRGFAGLLRLAFNKGLVNFTSMAVKRPSDVETIVTALVLAEKHDIEPKIVEAPPDASLEQMLAIADSALLVGDDAIFSPARDTSLLDVTDEWEDVVEAPLPYMVAWGRQGAVPQAALDELVEARDEAVLTLPDFVAQHAQAEEANAFYQRYLRGEIDYALGEPELGALDTYFRYAFYYSTISDIPALKFLPDGEPANFAAPRA